MNIINNFRSTVLFSGSLLVWHSAHAHFWSSFNVMNFRGLLCALANYYTIDCILSSINKWPNQLKVNIFRVSRVPCFKTFTANQKFHNVYMNNNWIIGLECKSSTISKLVSQSNRNHRNWQTLQIDSSLQIKRKLFASVFLLFCQNDKSWLLFTSQFCKLTHNILSKWLVWLLTTLIFLNLLCSTYCPTSKAY